MFDLFMMSSKIVCLHYCIFLFRLGLSIRAAGKKYNIPEATLRHKLTGYHSMDGKKGGQTLLTEAEEQILLNYIKNACRRAHPVTKTNVLKTVQCILDEEDRQGITRKKPPCFKGNAPKQKWWTLFKKRHPTLSFRTPEALTKARKSRSVRSIKEWFAHTRDFFTENDCLDALLDPARNYNIDETCFSLSPTQGKVVVPKGEKQVFEECSDSHKLNLTVLGCIGADGSVPPPMIIYPRKRVQKHIVERFPEGYAFTVGKSEKGWISFENLYEYLCNDFHDWLERKNVKRPVVIWTDWHETRNNYYLAKTLNELDIILYGLPPYTTHFLQPLDVAVFGPLKREWTKKVKEWEEEHEDEVINQVNFAELLLPVYYTHVTPDKIKAGFEKCGLVPFNPDRPDYSKLEASAAQKEHYSTIFEGVDQGGIKEVGVQTSIPLISRGTQTINKYEQVTTSVERRIHYNFTGSMCDLVIDFKGLSHLKKVYNDKPFAMREFGRIPPPLRTASSQVSPCVGSTLQKRSYPERRPGHGPKFIRTELDKTFAISSKVMINELKKKHENIVKKSKKKVVKKTKQGTGEETCIQRRVQQKGKSRKKIKERETRKNKKDQKRRQNKLVQKMRQKK